jgi:glyoxylase-like metal-dependent hydrolase (beta-lactamase superfamily II)
MIFHRFILGNLVTNCYLIADEHTKNAVLFDAPADGRKIIDYLNKNELKLKLILLTHAHFDHIYGLDDLVKSAKDDGKDIPVYIHSCDAAAMYDSEKNLSAPLFRTPYRYTGSLKAVFDGHTITVGSMNFLVIHTPGHTEGSACYICHADNVVFSGDVLFDGSIGRTDFPGGDMGKMKESLKKLMAVNKWYTVYPGHGGTTTIEQEMNFNPYIAGIEL